MVFCGKPSKACGPCRFRRTKCDKLKPSCSQCSRAGRICTGYREIQELEFRHCANSAGEIVVDESKKNTKKKNPIDASKETDLTKYSSPPSIGPKSPPFDPQSNYGSTSSLQNPLAEQLATSFFFKNYVLDEQLFSSGNFRYLKDIYHQQSVSTSLSDVIVAIGAAGLAHFYKDLKFMLIASKKYSSSLSALSIILRESTSAKQDQTLISVILLGLYEVNNCTGMKSIEILSQHIGGAEELLLLRGSQQLETSLGRELFTQVRAQILIRCWRTHTAVPQHIIEWSEIMRQDETVEEFAATRLFQISSRVCDLRMKSAQSSHSLDLFGLSGSEYFISCALEIESELSIWAATLPSAYRYHTVALEDNPEDIYLGEYHVYSSIAIAAIWNDYRIIRILVHELILQHSRQMEIEDSSSFFSQLVRDSTSIATQLAVEICSSVPFFLGFGPRNNREPKKSTYRKAITGNLLLWPLHIVARTRFNPTMREWAIGRLGVIADDMGIKQATVVIQL